MSNKYMSGTAGLLLSLVAVVVSTTVIGSEPWVDAKLSVTDGLVVWLDAAALNEARRAADAAPLQHDDVVDAWPNGAEAGHQFVQQDADARPIYRTKDSFHAIHFESPGQHLRSVKPLPAVNDLTVFIVAAPYSFPEMFSAFLSTNASGKNDFQTGLNIDQANGDRRQFSVLNVEGTGSSGAQNLLQKPVDFGSVVRICVTSTVGKDGVSLWVNDELQGTRDRDTEATQVSLDEIVLGARHYALGGPPTIQGFFHGDIAEVLIFDRSLSETERASVNQYLAAKYQSAGPMTVPAPPEGTELLVQVKDSVPVQMFVPGFNVRELPIELTNINNVQYRPDGVLVALGYDGRVWLLRDTDGDGIEDNAALFWENKDGIRSAIGMDLTPPGYEHGDGVVVVGKTQCLLILDTDHDDQADKTIEVAGGWHESFHQVDGLGVAFDPSDGSIYYGRGTHNFTDPLLRDAEGHATFSLEKHSGVIVRTSPDFKTREVFATGIRFPVGIRFNRNGDLFCTDQEGATWVPNGNPLDELLHVQRGRHYGFPSRHPKYLPNVIDEPSTFDYGPQHQSTCGFCFNEAETENGPTFGPTSWEGDAIVTGYSRGKLYRTQIGKTSNGYVARNQLIACLNMLTADCCLAPDGSLVVACHSGGPDWGSGPTGEGKLFKISYVDRDIPQPVLAWPATPREVRIEFDRAVAPELLKDVLGQIKIEAAKFVRAGDRFESLWPGYAVVQAQKQMPRRTVSVYSAQLTPDRRTLVLATDSLTAAVHYALTLPGMGRPPKSESADGESAQGLLPQYPQIDLDFDLSGVEATWTVDGEPAWRGWLPSLDLDLSRRWTVGSAEHDRLWQAMEQPGTLTLRTQLDLHDLLRPAVQPGSTLDYEYPRELVTLTFDSSVQLSTHVSVESLRTHAMDHHTTITAERDFDSSQAVPFEIQLTKRDVGSQIDLSVSYSTNEDDRARPLQLHRAHLPWADTQNQGYELEPLVLPEELNGGSWARGRQVFFGEKAGCAKCHAVNHQGSQIGPDLSNLVHRDYASVLRDVLQPSFAINPDYVTSTLLLRDGRVLVGVVQTQGDKVHVGDKEGKTIVIDKSQVEEMQSSRLSVMPEEILKTLTAAQTRDLFTYLLSRPPSMPRDGTSGARPKPRAVADVNEVLAGAPQPPQITRPIQIVLAAGPKDHGPGEHDYPAWQTVWTELLSAADDTDVATAWLWPTPEQFATADIIVFYQHGDWNMERATDIDAYLKRGGGLVYVHWAVDGQKQGPEFAQRIGLAARGLVGFRHGDMTLAMNRLISHPVLRNFSELALTDETYWKMVGDLQPDQILATAIEDNQPQPQVWSLEQGAGRVFVSIPGHYSWTFDDPLFRILLLRGIAWAAKEPVDRFNDLVWPGADVVR